MKIKKAKNTKKCVIKRKPKFQDYKNCLEAAQSESKLNHFEKNRTGVGSLKQDQKQFLKNNKLILKTKQRFRSEKHTVFTEEIKRLL